MITAFCCSKSFSLDDVRVACPEKPPSVHHRPPALRRLATRLAVHSLPLAHGDVFVIRHFPRKCARCRRCLKTTRTLPVGSSHSQHVFIVARGERAVKLTCNSRSWDFTDFSSFPSNFTISSASSGCSSTRVSMALMSVLWITQSACASGGRMRVATGPGSSKLKLRFVDACWGTIHNEHVVICA